MGALVKVFILHQLYIADVGKMNSLTPRKFGEMAYTSLSGSSAIEPVQSVMPLAGESTARQIQSRSSRF